MRPRSLPHANVENEIYKIIALHMRSVHRGVVYHFDTSGVNNTSKYSRGLYKYLNGESGWPDLFIAAPSHPDFGNFHGLFIEVKKLGTRIRRADGELVADEHIRDQAEMIARLNKAGYYAAFATGIDSCIELIDQYLSGTSNLKIEF